MGTTAGDVWTRRIATATALLFPVVAGAVTLAASATFDGGLAVDRPSARWQTIEHDGLRVDVPSAWHRADLSGCDRGDAEVWTPSADDACGDGPGIAFLDSATLCASDGRGIREEPGSGSERWTGCRRVGETAVSVTAAHRSIARQVLRSADRAAEQDEPPAGPTVR